MIDPTRRRNGALSLLPTYLLTLLLLTSAASAASAVLGIDLGNEYIKAALIKPGIPLDIVLSRDSKRKEAVAVAFKPSGGKKDATVPEGSYPERLYGSDALALTGRRPGDVYTNLKQLLGLPLSAGAVQEYKRRYPALSLVGEESVSFTSPSFANADMRFLVEEILAMELKNVRENAQEMAGKGLRVTNVVFTIPAFWSAAERRALELAADLAGLKVLAMITDGVAVGINYATTRTFASINEKAKDGSLGRPELHMVFDMGAGSTRATVLKIQARSVKDFGRFNKTITEVINLGSAWDETLGGDALNALIVQDMITKFVESSAAKSAGVKAADVAADGRVNAKLWKDAEKLRQVLSANQQASASFESLYDDVDFRYKLERPDLEALMKDFVARIKTPFESALKSAKATLDDLDSIILHGGMVRTPAIQKQLETLAGGNPAKLKSNVNSDEAAVFGAAFKAAGLSPSFKVKEIRDIDVGGHPAGIKYTLDGKQKTQKLFVETSLTGAIKTMTVAAKDDFDYVLFQTAGGVEKEIFRGSFTNLTTSVKKLTDGFGCNKKDIETKLSLRLSPTSGLPEVVQGSVSCEVEEGKKGGIADGVKGLFGFGKKDKTSSDESSAAEQKSGSASASKSGKSSKSKSKKGSSSSAVADDANAAPKYRTETINVAFQSSPQTIPGRSSKEVKKLKARLSAFDKSDASRTELSDLLNSIEGLTYRVRDWLSDTGFTNYASETEQTTLGKLAEEASEWIYGEGATAAATALKEKLKGLEDIVNPIKLRREEAQARPQALADLQEAVTHLGNYVVGIKVKMEEAEAAAEEAALDKLSAASESVGSVASEASESVSSFMTTGDKKASVTTSATSSATSAPAMEWKDEDYLDLSKLFKETSDWLNERIRKQAELTDADDAVVSVAELLEKAKYVQGEVAFVIQRRTIAMKQEKQRAELAAERARKSKAAKKSASENTGLTETATEGADGGTGSSGQSETKKSATGSSAPTAAKSSPTEAAPSHGEL